VVVEQTVATVARNVRSSRSRLGWTLEQLCARSGVSKGALVALENGSGNPNLATLIRITDALGVPLSVLLADGPAESVVVVDPETLEPLWTGPLGGSARLLFSTTSPSLTELWRWVLPVGERYLSEAHPGGIVETLTVVEGTLELTINGVVRQVPAGSSAMFSAGVPHGYTGGADTGCTMVLTVHLPGFGASQPGPV
jgi:transcriptional regulator with XRE-family HTH domain